MPYLKGIIRLSLGMAFVALAALVISYIQLRDVFSDNMNEWVAVRVSLAIFAVFIAVTVIALSRVLRHIRRMR
jgi:hypothetical protein